jgi:hypothetical protein
MRYYSLFKITAVNNSDEPKCQKIGFRVLEKIANNTFGAIILIIEIPLKLHSN